MSGTEFIAVAGVISSIIAIVGGIKQVVDAASEVEGLPTAFRQASNKLPLVSDILEATKHNFGEDNVSGVEKSVALVLDDCKDKWKTLNDLFDKVIPEEKASRVDRYYKAVKTLGKGGKVESLMKGILEDIQLLATIKTMTTTNVEKVIKTTTAAQEERVAKAITDVAAWPSSIPDDVFQEGAYTFTNIGTGQYIALGDAEQNIFGGESRQYHSGGGSQTINEAQTIINGIPNIYPLHEAPACLTALFLTNPRDDRQKLIYAKGTRVDGTCEWIKRNPLYELWLCSHSQLLWLSGGPGKGKTMLSIFLAEELERTAKDSQDISFLQFFCDNRDEKRNTAVAIIRGMIFQLLQLRPKLIDHILPSFQIQKESLFTSPAFETLWGIFEHMLRDPALGAVYCILDGLDECDEASLEVLLNKFKALFSTKFGESSACYLNLIIASRDFPEFIPEILSGFPRIRLDSDADTDINDDIHRFIKFKVNKLSVDKRYPKALREHVKGVFQDRAKGTFLWVGIVAEGLRKYKATQVETALSHFPSGLGELYARMLLQIEDDQRETAAMILRWVVMAVRPLTVSELSAAIGIADRPSTFFSPDEVMRDQVSCCGYFLMIKDHEVGLIHQSAKDYLLRETPDSNPKLEVFRIQKEVASLEIARKCFHYLQNGALAAGGVNLKTDISHSKAFPLLSYAALHWPEHAKTLACSEDIFDLSLPFYHENSCIREFWLETYWAMREFGKAPNSFTLLHLASYFGILPLAKNILLKNVSREKVERLLYLNKKDDRKRTALIWAALKGNETLVQLLLEKGADIEANDNDGKTALLWVTLLGKENLVQLLLEKGADIEAKNSDGRTALLLVALLGNEAIVQLLLKEGADIEAKDNDGRTALLRAALLGNEAAVLLLLEKGADIEAKDNDGRTALLNMALLGKEALVQLLLEKGADIEAKGNDGRTALLNMALLGKEALVQLLLEKGADIEAKDSNKRTALLWAASLGKETLMQLLLKDGADIEAKDNNGRTALLRAALLGNETIVQLLLEKGADIEANDNDGSTALLRAASLGNEAIVQLLLEKGADIKANDNNRTTALLWAASLGKETLMQLLLKDGADIEAKDNNGRTALLRAALLGNEATVLLLLEKGADIEAKDNSGRTALLNMALLGKEALVQLLLEKGADIKAKNRMEARCYFGWLHKAMRP
ncbi:uncharacterized protein PAC_08628 [Phialocephala subalpina]|uniref:Uncharacterized protein n=1 Tax=Phialocephala subalpina TaxID=576137 RepID=A0A1L7X143_9HELO|nr:uncharacterized protein PAC_08628 [Phialocephala subalpina]